MSSYILFIFILLINLTYSSELNGNEFIDYNQIKKDFYEADTLKQYQRCEEHLLLAMSNCSTSRPKVCAFISELGTIALNRNIIFSKGMNQDLNNFFKYHYNLDFLSRTKDLKTIKEFKQIPLLQTDKKEQMKYYRAPGF